MQTPKDIAGGGQTLKDRALLHGQEGFLERVGLPQRAAGAAGLGKDAVPARCFGQIHSGEHRQTHPVGAAAVEFAGREGFIAGEVKPSLARAGVPAESCGRHMPKQPLEAVGGVRPDIEIEPDPGAVEG